MHWFCEGVDGINDDQGGLSPKKKFTIKTINGHRFGQ